MRVSHADSLAQVICPDWHHVPAEELGLQPHKVRWSDTFQDAMRQKKLLHIPSASAN